MRWGIARAESESIWRRAENDFDSLSSRETQCDGGRGHPASFLNENFVDYMGRKEREREKEGGGTRQKTNSDFN